MVQRARFVSCLTVAVLTSLGCEATQVLVRFEADEGALARATSFRVRVWNEEGELAFSRVETPAAIPSTLPLVPLDGDSSRSFVVLGELRDGRGTFNRQRLVGTYASGERQTFVLRFEAGCDDVLECGLEETCKGGACADARVNGASLPAALRTIELAHRWSVVVGGGESDLAGAVAVGSGEDVYVTGTVRGEVELAMLTQTSDWPEPFVASFRPGAGAVEARWAQRYAAGATDSDGIAPRGLALATAPGVVAAGGRLHDLIVIDGRVVYNGTGGGDDLYVVELGESDGVARSERVPRTLGRTVANALASDGRGGFVVAGALRGVWGEVPGAAPVSVGDSLDVLLVTSDRAAAFGGSGEDEALSVAVAGDRACLAGRHAGPAAFGAQTLDGDGSADGFVACVAEGDVAWARAIASTGGDEARGIAADASGALYVTGSISGAVSLDSASLAPAAARDAFVAAFTSEGTLRWARTLGATESATGAAISIGSDGDVVVAGTFVGALSADDAPLDLRSAGGEDVFVAMLDGSDGSIRGWRAFGGQAGERASSVAVAPSGAIAVSGEVDGEADFGGGPLVHHGRSDVFVLSLEATR